MTRHLPFIAVMAFNVLAFCLMFYTPGCDDKPQGGTMAEQPDRVGGSLGPPASQPETAEEWVRLTNELDSARAENARKDLELQNAENRKAAANIDTWKRFGRYSFYFMAIGVAMMVAGLLPWTKPFFAGTQSIALIFIGGGVLFAALPHVLENYGPTAFYPLAAISVLYVGTLAGIDIFRRLRRARAEAIVASHVCNPNQPEEARDLIAHRAKADPMLAKQLERVGVPA